MIDINLRYYESFKEYKKGNKNMYKKSWRQYENTIIDFLQDLDKDVVAIGQGDLTAYLSKYTNNNTKKSKESYIRSFIKFIIEANIEQSRTRVGAFVLTYTKIIPDWFLYDSNHDFTMVKQSIVLK